MQKPRGLMVCVVLEALFCAVIGITGYQMMHAGGGAAAAPLADTMVLKALGLFFVGVAVLTGAVAANLYNLRKWARVAAIILGVLYLIPFPRGANWMAWYVFYAVPSAVVLYYLTLNRETISAFSQKPSAPSS